MKETIYGSDECDCDWLNLLLVDEWDVAEYKGTLKRRETKSEDVLSRIGYCLITGQLGKALSIYNKYVGKK